MATTVLGIDLGTSSVKAVVATPQGRVLATARAEYPIEVPRPSWSETNPLAWLEATAGTVREALARAAAVDATTPTAIGLSGQMHGVVLADQAGWPLRPAMLWSDSRASDHLRAYTALPEHVRRRLANPLSPGMAGPMLSWLSHSEPGVLARARWALQPKDWLRAQLTGEFHTEPSDASATLLYDVAADAWDDTVLSSLGIERALLPDVLPSSSALAGHLCRDAAEMLGMPAGTPVAAGAGDTAAAALGSGLSDPGTAQLTLGTGVQVVRPVTTLPADLPPRPVTHLYRAATASGWYRMGAALNGGLALGWVRRVLNADWAELYATAGRDPDPDAPYFLPHLHGERTPYLDPSLRGAWTGLSPSHERGDLLHASLEGVAFAAKDAFLPVVAAGDVSHLRLAGGGAASPAWRQLLADVLDVPLAPLDVSAASALGAALLGAIAADLTDEDTALAPRATPAAVDTWPRARFTTLYRDRYSAFGAQVGALASQRRQTGDDLGQRRFDHPSPSATQA